MAVGVAHGPDDRSLAIRVDADKMVRGAGGCHGIDGDMETAFGAVLKTNRHGDPAGHFSMCLAFGRPGADGRPADEIGNVLRADRIQQLCPAGKAQLIDLEKNSPRQLHSRRDIAGPVEMWVIDQALPSDRGPRLFKVGPHHDQEAVTQGISDRFQLGGIFIRGIGVVNRAGAYDNQKPVAVLPMKNAANGLSSLHDERRRLIGNREFSLNGARRGQRFNLNNVLIVDGPTHESSRPCERSGPP